MAEASQAQEVTLQVTVIRADGTREEVPAVVTITKES